MNDDMAPDAQAHSSDDEYIGNAHIPKVNLLQDWWKPLEEDRPATPEPAWSISSSDVHIPKNNWASALASTYSSPPEDSLLAQTGDMTIHTPEGDRRAVRTHMRILSVVRIEVFSMYRQRVENLQLEIESYQTYLNLTKPRWDATGFEYKHDYMIDKALDYRVKEFKANRMNLGLNTRFWTRKDMERSKEFMFAIQKRLKTMRIFRNLESFVGG
nr:hypothetical protein [Tanacetum cinerariifolium]